MKRLIAGIALAAAACATPALARDAGISIHVGDPGFYGQLHIGSGYRPRVHYSEPVIIERRHRNAAPVYVRVPREHSRNWSRHCGRYNACARPVYFVRDEWYRDVYVPRHRKHHAQGWNDHRGYDRRDQREDRRDHRRDDRRGDRRDDRGDRRHDRR